VADADGRDRNVDWFYRGLDMGTLDSTPRRHRWCSRLQRVTRRRTRARWVAAQRVAAVPRRRTWCRWCDSAAARPQERWTAGGGAADPGGGGRGGAAVPYWGKYAYHDNNRDINIKLVQMRAIIDWYFTAHPPSCTTCMKRSRCSTRTRAARPESQSRPILFAELPWFGNWELAQMTKYGMPGVYTHAFMDGWSPGYLGSVAYNHNG
jgi:hypothetical protein